MKRLNLYELSKKAIGVSDTFGKFLGEAAHVCLELQGHKSGVQINVLGLYKENLILEWDKELEEETFLSWKDVKEATEYGATAIALLLMLHFEDYNFIERLPQFGIGDYVLEKRAFKSKQAKKETHLEISGIFKVTNTNTLDIRINQKEKQLSKKQTTTLNVLIAVVEFSKPAAKIIKL